jgi:phosphoribosylcarboxyaminoimidazole (NCAIR) mutase
MSLIWFLYFEGCSVDSPSDDKFCKKIVEHCKDLDLISKLWVTTAHRETKEIS